MYKVILSPQKDSKFIIEAFVPKIYQSCLNPNSKAVQVREYPNLYENQCADYGIYNYYYYKYLNYKYKPNEHTQHIYYIPYYQLLSIRHTNLSIKCKPNRRYIYFGFLFREIVSVIFIEY